MIKYVLAFFIWAIASPAPAQGFARFIVKAKPGFLEINGNGAEVVGKVMISGDNMVTGKFSVDLRNLSTGDGFRDRYMRNRCLEVHKYPEAVFLLDPLLFASGRSRLFTGTLTLHGVSEQITGIVDFNATTANAYFSIDATAFGIDVPTYQLLTLGKEVEVRVTVPI